MDIFHLFIILKIKIFEIIHTKSFEIGGQLFWRDAKKYRWHLGHSTFFLNDHDEHTFKVKYSRNTFIKRIKQIKRDLAISSFKNSLNHT